MPMKCHWATSRSPRRGRSGRRRRFPIPPPFGRLHAPTIRMGCPQFRSLPARPSTRSRPSRAAPQRAGSACRYALCSRWQGSRPLPLVPRPRAASPREDSTSCCTQAGPHTVFEAKGVPPLTSRKARIWRTEGESKRAVYHCHIALASVEDGVPIAHVSAE